jgi:response regulator RpfG family c-di-GMP phosphodiesterase
VSETLMRGPALAVPPTAPAAAVATVLCVDDEPNILSALRRALRSDQVRVLTADGGAQGLQVLEREPVDLVISDMRMPGMDGAQFLEQVHARWPQALRILLTGHADMATTIAAINRGRIYRYINKPWDDAELQGAVRQALEHATLAREARRLEALTHAQNETLRELNASLEQRVEQRTAEVSQAHDKLKRNYLTSIKVFSNLIELRGGTLLGHGRRVGDLVRKVARAMELPEDQAQDIFVAGLLHDVGLIGVPDVMLAKPVPKMNPDELALYRKHPVLGEQSLMALDDMQTVAAIIRAHHERFDGQGFPDRRAGPDIPLGARILSVVDVFDDLQSGHLAGAAMSAEEARMLLRRGRGQQFDPEVLDVFLHITEPNQPKKGEPLRVSAQGLEPDMVLARDLMSPQGALLLAAGQRLTQPLVERIRNFERREGVLIELHVFPAGSPR